MSQRQSCDRCRQQKVRCFWDSASHGAHGLPRCQRCFKAGVDCVYSSNRKLSHDTSQPTRRNEPTMQNEPPKPPNTSWFALGFGGIFCQNGPGISGNDLDVSAFPAIADGRGVVPSMDVADLNGWDVSHQVFPWVTSANPRESSQPSAATLEAMLTKEASDTLNGPGERPGSANNWETPTSAIFTIANDAPDLDDASSALFWQLTGLSLKITRARRRLTGPNAQPPTVSSPEVTEALEYTNTLTDVFNKIVAAASSSDKTGGIAPSSTTSSSITPAAIDNSVILLALASHQHLITLLEAICDAVRRCLDSVSASTDRRDPSQGKVGAFSVAHFVMVLQLLMHLINRIDRSLFQVRQHSAANGAYIITEHGLSSMEGVQNNEVEDSTSQYLVQQPQGSLPALAVGVVQGLPDQLGRLRKIIQELQTTMDSRDYSN
ncbi:hypothetical protein B0I35DRAFT_177203 [Stachybotrys elegans]|uniref:Zn(2)-C6 fungal-type domain-containing protein n=1 Tax=Stachybotrys elegans TaxID=80388 RepID=A0A8K0S8V5_9HYPO|nr:hypothetical protein B0I35DRAFT_177203 [Stachybotrys elegans]